MENSSFIEKIKNYFFSQILNFRLDLYLKLNEKGNDDENRRFEQNEDLKWKSIKNQKSP